MKAVVIALALYAAMPADSAAACHRYRVWHFRTPQRCELESARVALAAVKADRREEVLRHSRKSPLSGPPAVAANPKAGDVEKPLSDDEAHAIGIELLRMKMEEDRK
jgi:hypothetical protein